MSCEDCYGIDCIRYPDCSPCEEDDLGDSNWPSLCSGESEDDDNPVNCSHHGDRDCHRHHHHCHHRDCCCTNNIYVCPPKKRKGATFAQVLDPNLSASLTENGPIQIAAAESALEQRGGFSLSTNTLTYDTLNFPDKGVYLVNINLDYSFLPPTDIAIGTFYQVVVQVEGVNTTSFLPEIVINTGITTTNTISTTLVRNFLVNATGTSTAIRLNLSNFNFNVSFNQSISFMPAITVTKLSSKPL